MIPLILIPHTFIIRYTKEDATDEEMREAARQANALKFIEENQFGKTFRYFRVSSHEFSEETSKEKDKNFGERFQRLVGPKGSQLSGGQKQRIAIARALLKKPTILLLDEATSALDTQSEHVVQESLDSIMKGKTSVTVAHRISTIKDANQILVFENGEIVEKGRYDELVQAQEKFYHLEKGT